MSLSSVEQWWEEWQLRILVLGSLCVQLYLAWYAPARKLSWLVTWHRLLLWMAYLGGDALAIYSLATLFNRHKKRQDNSSPSANDLEVLWSPILLMHLGGPMGISAYNIEDNELWMRHLATVISQVTVTIYVFYNSWSPVADKRLLVVAILLFIVGVCRCFDKPIALKRASFKSVVTSFIAAKGTVSSHGEVELESYIQNARHVVQCNRDPQTLSEEDEIRYHLRNLHIPDKLFADLAYTYGERLGKLNAFWHLDFEQAFQVLRIGLSRTFNLIYTKYWNCGDKNRLPPFLDNILSYILWLPTLILPIVSIILFHISHKEAYSGIDIKITFLLLYTTYFLEIISGMGMTVYSIRAFPGMVAQLSVVQTVARDGFIHKIMECLRFKGLFDEFCFDRTHSSKDITMLVHGHIKNGWMNYIRDVESYWMFTDTRGHKTLDRMNCTSKTLLESIEKPLDESVILWHLATDFCFCHVDTPPVSAGDCRQISNYMAHLLAVKPEMLMPTCTSHLFTEAHKQLKKILSGDDVSSLLKGNRLTHRFIDRLKSKNGIIPKAWEIAQELMQLQADDDGGRMWEVIRGVWIEMLCFSACRCRGYMHAKGLGYGGEYLTFVSLTMSHGGLETFAERQQRMRLRLTSEERLSKALQLEELVLEETGTNQEAGVSTEV